MHVEHEEAEKCI